MFIVGLTGGIASGKTTISDLFKKKKIPTYNCDIKAKYIMENFFFLKKKIINNFSLKFYKKNGKLNIKYISNIVFSNYNILFKLTTLIYPYVLCDFKNWILNNNKKKYCIKESAILFEYNINLLCDLTILIVAPIKRRIKVLKKRYNLKNKYDVLKRINCQFSDITKINKSNIVIYNNKDIDVLKTKINKIHNYILYKKFCA